MEDDFSNKIAAIARAGIASASRLLEDPPEVERLRQMVFDAAAKERARRDEQDDLLRRAVEAQETLAAEAKAKQARRAKAASDKDQRRGGYPPSPGRAAQDRPRAKAIRRHQEGACGKGGWISSAAQARKCREIQGLLPWLSSEPTRNRRTLAVVAGRGTRYATAGNDAAGRT